jgi:U3 small nucleolar ribonucleoprotein protein LCP5
MTDEENIRLQTLTKYKELNEQLREFLKNILVFEKSSSLNEEISSIINDNGGISLLSVKNDLLLHYLINLVAVMHRRSTPNQSLNSSSTRSMILRLCEIRTFIEKIRPIEQKLQYQMDKLLKNNVDQQLNHRANIENFDADINEKEETNNDEDEEETEKPKIYRPPKLVPVEYNEDFNDKNENGTTNKRLEHLKRRAYHSDILEDFKSKYSDAPEEIYNSERSRLLQQNRSYKEKVAYEEDYLKRLPQTKRERSQLQRSMMANGSEVMDHMHDADVLYDDNLNGSMKKKKGKLSRRTKKRVEKKKTKSAKRLKSRK